MEGQLSLFETIKTDEILMKNQCITCDFFKKYGYKGTGKTYNMLFPCFWAEVDYNEDENIGNECKHYKPNLALFDCCYSCRYSNCFMEESNYCSRTEKEYPNYKCVDGFEDYLSKCNKCLNFLNHYIYYICDNYEPDLRLRKERI